MDLPTQTVGRFEVVGHLATGGMAEILLGRLLGPSGFERPVVIKKILPHLAREPRFVSMFLDEARIAARIRHPNVVQVHELGHESGELFLVMEFLEGESLAGLMRRLTRRQEQLEPALASHIAAEVCAGLHAAHELVDERGAPVRLVHRDVSPQNIFITYDGAVKVLDFGIAVAADRVTKTETGQLKGKAEYMAPEQCLGKPLDRRADLFSLGTVLFEMSVGRRLFRRDNKLLTLKAITADPIPRPTSISQACPAALERVVIRALSRKRSDRFQTALEMRRELIAVSRQLAPDLVGDDGLRALMLRTFSDRIAEKRVMLTRARGGSRLTEIPAAEADPQVELPVVQETEIQVATASDGLVTPSGRPASRVSRRKAGFALAAVIAIGSGTVAGAIGFFGVGEKTERSSPVDLPRAQDAVAMHPPAPAQVMLILKSTPSGASVELDGLRRGETPASLRLPKSDREVEVALNLHGYRRKTTAWVPATDTELSLELEPTPRKSGASSPRITAKPKPPSASASSTPPAYPKW